MVTKEAQQWLESQKEGDMGVFDRQLRIQNWDQGKVASQVCLLLGVGGLGTGVAMGLARLGVKKLILIDKENVELSNLNRQILFSYQHVGQRKCEAAKQVLLDSHRLNPDMTVECYHMDVLIEW